MNNATTKYLVDGIVTSEAVQRHANPRPTFRLSKKAANRFFFGESTELLPQVMILRGQVLVDTGYGYNEKFTNLGEAFAKHPKMELPEHLRKMLMAQRKAGKLEIFLEKK